MVAVWTGDAIPCQSRWPGVRFTWWPNSRRPVWITFAVFALAVAVTVPVLHRLGQARSVRLPLRSLAMIALPAHDSRFDYADVDPVAHRLFLAHMGDGTLLELDTHTNTVLATVTGLPTVTGVIVVPALHRVFASVAGTGQVAMIDEDTATVLTRAPAGQFPDGLAYVASTGQVWVSDESGGVQTVLDARTGQRVETVQLGGEAGNVRYDPSTDRVLVDVQSQGEVVVLDPHSRAIVRRVKVAGCDHPHGLLLDGARAFVACDGNNQLLTLALPNLTVLGHVRVGDGPDVLALDSTLQVLYVAAESGVVTTLDLHSRAGRVTGRAHLAGNAHVVAVDESTGRAYFPVSDAGDGKPGLLITTLTLSASEGTRS